MPSLASRRAPRRDATSCKTVSSGNIIVWVCQRFSLTDATRL